MRLDEIFDFCPRCGRPQPRAARNPFACAACGHVQYFNPAVAVAAFLQHGDRRMLFLRRAKEPAQGKLATPGGFVDIGETAEAALRREVREEVNLQVVSQEFLCSQLNEYRYKGVTYPVLDLFFVARVASLASAEALDGVASLCWLDPAEVPRGEIAFPSVHQALQVLLGRLGLED